MNPQTHPAPADGVDEDKGIIMTMIERSVEIPMERRLEPRLLVHLPVHVVDTEGDFGIITGETVDLGVGGLRARLWEPLPSTCETTVQLDLPDGTEVVTEARVADGGATPDGFEYRLVFLHLGASEADALSRLIADAA